MFVIDDRNLDFYKKIASISCGRGLECIALSNYEINSASKPFATFLTGVYADVDCSKDKDLIDLIKKKRFKRSYVAKFEAKNYDINSFFNDAITVLDIPDTFPALSLAHSFYLHSFINLAIKEVPNLPCQSEHSFKLVQLIKKVSPSNATVLINGPTGTGKEVISRLIHDFSRRKEKAYVALNCAAVPDQMLESILFGHEKGSFTGAIQSNVGLLRAADGGTILLDEISEMPVNLQSKLLRVIQEKKVMPIGSTSEIDVDVRILATTNRNMMDEVSAGRFREDLFYRLNVFPISNLSLSHRPEDVVPIVSHILIKAYLECGQLFSLTNEALSELVSYSWPGNVRELDNLIQRALIICDSKEISDADLIFDSNGETDKPNTAEILASKFKSMPDSEVLS